MESAVAKPKDGKHRTVLHLRPLGPLTTQPLVSVYSCIRVSLGATPPGVCLRRRRRCGARVRKPQQCTVHCCIVLYTGTQER